MLYHLELQMQRLRPGSLSRDGQSPGSSETTGPFWLQSVKAECTFGSRFRRRVAWQLCVTCHCDSLRCRAPWGEGSSWEQPRTLFGLWQTRGGVPSVKCRHLLSFPPAPPSSPLLSHEGRASHSGSAARGGMSSGLHSRCFSHPSARVDFGGSDLGSDPCLTSHQIFFLP